MLKNYIKYKNIISVLMMFFLFGLFILSSQVVFAADSYGLKETKDAATNLYDSGLTDSGFAKTVVTGKVGAMVGFFLAFTGVSFMILIIVAGTIWMNAGGNEQAVTKAKDTIIAAIIGLVITLAAYAITKLLGDFLMTPPTP